MIPCLFASDLHGRTALYEKLLQSIEEEPPVAVFLGGDLLPPGFAALDASGQATGDFLVDFLIRELRALRARLGPRYPTILLILGNDDVRAKEQGVRTGEVDGLWRYLHGRRCDLSGFQAYGYSFVPPTPFLCKDWERYDVSRYVPPGCVSPEEGWRSVAVPPQEVRYGTITGDLNVLAGNADLSGAVFLFHTPPYETMLDRAGLDGRVVDHVPLDLHVGSIAVRRFIEARQPLLTLHGHVHESARLTGSWKDRIGRTHLFTGAHDGPELAVVRFDLEDLADATRVLL